MQILDGVDSLATDPDLPLFVHWLPYYLPLNVNLILTYTYDAAHEAASAEAAFHRFALGRLRRRFKGDAADTGNCTNTFVEIASLAEHRSTRREFNPRPIVSYYVEKAGRSITRPQVEACIYALLPI